VSAFSVAIPIKKPTHPNVNATPYAASVKVTADLRANLRPTWNRRNALMRGAPRGLTNIATIYFLDDLAVRIACATSDTASLMLVSLGPIRRTKQPPTTPPQGSCFSLA
jgi:hypothetical protein